MICGFGRLGAWFGCTTYDVKPDIITIAKGLSSGYLPVAGIIASDRVVDGLKQGGEFTHGYTYSGHPAACAAALMNIEIMEREGLIDQVANDTGPYFRERWMTLSDHPLVGEARARGLMGAVELVADKSTNAAFPDPGTAGAMCRTHSMDNGLIMRAVYDRLVISPPLIITHEQIDELVALARNALDSTFSSLKAQGRIH